MSVYGILHFYLAFILSIENMLTSLMLYFLYFAILLFLFYFFGAGPIRCVSFTPANLNPLPQFLFIGSDNGMISIVEHDE